MAVLESPGGLVCSLLLHNAYFRGEDVAQAFLTIKVSLTEGATHSPRGREWALQNTGQTLVVCPVNTGSLEHRVSGSTRPSVGLLTQPSPIGNGSTGHPRTMIAVFTLACDMWQRG